MNRFKRLIALLAACALMTCVLLPAFADVIYSNTIRVRVVKVRATEEPTVEPTEEVTEEPTVEPTEEVTEEPTVEPTEEVTEEPTVEPTEEVTAEPTAEPTEEAAETPDPEVAETLDPEATVTPDPEATVTPEPTEIPVQDENKLPEGIDMDIQTEYHMAGELLSYGDTVTLTATLFGAEGRDIELQWQIIPNGGSDWEDVLGENALTVTFELDARTASSSWRLRVIENLPQMADAPEAETQGE